MTLKILDLFSGIGGFSYAAERLVGGFETVGFCEIDPYCQKVLKKHWPDVPIHNDVRRLADEADGYRGLVDVVCGGFPCQPFSLASSNRKGQEDGRHLWPEMLRIIKATRPRFVIGENVAGHITLGLDDVLSDLAQQDYTARAFVIPACAKDARHRRDRVWIVGHTSSIKRNARPEKQRTLREVPENEREHDNSGGSGEAHTSNATNPNSKRGKRVGEKQKHEESFRLRNRKAQWRESRWEPEPRILRVAYGIPNRVDRIKSLGNSIVPQVAAEIFTAIKAMAND